jgi:hypothetical protein
MQPAMDYCEPKVRYVVHLYGGEVLKLLPA